MTVIVYVSNTGSAKQYAEMLGEKTGYPVFDFANASDVPADAQVIFIGWVMAGTVQGLKEARDLFTIKAVCPVGMMKSEKQDAELKTKNAITEPMFSLLGNFHIDNLSGMYKMMMNMMLKMMKSKLKQDDVPDGQKAVEALEKGVDCVSEEHLGEIMGWLDE
ncbi:MAG: hypothetical protein IJ491_02400 [Clostridia bacterium]|nr:hypothetical protein [Clostridia bacterium]